jgi:hypothetical protein
VTALLLALVGAAGGLFGALMGVGGGLIVVPALTQLFGVPFPQAVAVSLTVIIVNSAASSAAYVEKGITDVRVAVVLELATVGGALLGSLLAAHVPQAMLLGLFTVVAWYTAWTTWRRRGQSREGQTAGEHEVRSWGAGVGVGLVAGAVSGLIGVGGGFLMVPAMSLLMGMPFKVAAATSNLMLSVTAATSAYVYVARGDLDLAVAAPTVVGVYVGARLGSSLLPRIPAVRLQGAFALVLAVIGSRMALQAWRLLR